MHKFTSYWRWLLAGQQLPSAAKDTLLSGADLLRTMESQPQTRKPMWEADSSDNSSDSDTEEHYSDGSPKAYAAPCMTIGAGTYGSGVSLLGLADFWGPASSASICSATDLVGS